MVKISLAVMFAALTAAAPAWAQEGGRFHDAETGLSVDLPAPYVLAGRQDRPSYDIALAVKAGEGATVHPANSDGSLCGVAYVSAPSNEGLTQTQINAVVAGEGWLATAKAPMALLGKVEQAQTFTQAQAYTKGAGGRPSVKGGEFVIAPATGPGAETTRLYIAMWETPKGRVVVTCAGLVGEMPAALDAFRAVRGSVTAGG